MRNEKKFYYCCLLLVHNIHDFLLFCCHLNKNLSEDVHCIVDIIDLILRAFLIIQ
jgi:hypothetical protein